MKAKKYTKNEVKEILRKSPSLQEYPWYFEEIRTADSWKRSLQSLMVRSRTSRVSKWIDSVVRAGSNRNRY